MTKEQIEYHIRFLNCHKNIFYDTESPRPLVGKEDVLYVNKDTGVTYVWNGSQYIASDSNINFVDALPVTGVEDILYVLPDGTIHIWDGTAFIASGVTDHGSLTGLTDSDDHTQYVLLAGRSGGQLINGGTVAGNSLTLSSTSNATKGSIIFGDSRYNESTNRFVLGTATGTSRINLPDAGTTASDGISFGASLVNLYRLNSNTLKTDGNLAIGASYLLSANYISPVNNIGRIYFSGGGATGGYTFGSNVSTVSWMDLQAPTLTGSSATSALSISQTWNTTGSPTAIFANVTNTASGASANLMDLQQNGTSRFKVSKDGFVTAETYNSPGYYSFYGQRVMLQQTGVNRAMVRFGTISNSITLTSPGENDFGLLQFGSGTNLFPAWKRNTTNLEARLADDSAQTGILANNINFGTTTGTGRINLPDAGTTASDGISFGTGTSNLYRNGANSIRTDGALQVLGAITNNNNNIVVSSNNIYNQNATGIEYGRYGGGGGLRLYPNNTVLGAELKVNGEFALTPPSLTGSSATSILNLTQTWNTTGSPTALNVNITNTASGASANLMDLQVGGVSQFRVNKFGSTTLGSSLTISGGITATFNTSTPNTNQYVFSGSNNSISGTNSGIINSTSFQPLSGTAIFSAYLYQGIINQTGGANGITRGIFVNPTLTAAADWRGAEFVTPSNTVIIGRNTGSAAVDVQSTTQGFLPPRMTATQASAIASPAQGLLLFVTDTNGTFTTVGWWGYNGTSWQSL
jgi:hypothetical protein